MGLLVILWNIIKVIGFIILVVLLLFVLMMLLILFSPICYQIAGNDRECINGKFDIKWILGAVHAYGLYDKEGLRFSLRFFGLCIYGADKKEKHRKEKRKKEEYTQEDVMLSARSKEQEYSTVEQEQQVEKIEEIEKGEIKQETEQEVEQEQRIEQKRQQHSRQNLSDIEDIEKESKKYKKAKKEEQKKTKNKKIKSKRVKKNKKNKKSNEKLKFYANYFWNMENKKELVQGIIIFCKRILKGVAPKQCYLKATVGTGDPALTGYVLAAVGALHMKFGKGLQVTGDFTQKVIKDVFLDIKGKILLGYLLYAVLRLVFLKPVLQTIKVIWKG